MSQKSIKNMIFVLLIFPNFLFRLFCSFYIFSDRVYIWNICLKPPVSFHHVFFTNNLNKFNDFYICVCFSQIIKKIFIFLIFFLIWHTKVGLVSWIGILMRNARHAKHRLRLDSLFFRAMHFAWEFLFYFIIQTHVKIFFK